MPLLANRNTNELGIAVRTEADGSGIDETEKALESLGATTKATDARVSSFAESFSNGLHKVAKVTAIAGAGLTLYAKSSIDKLGELVKTTKLLSTQTGMSITESSRLANVLKRLGLDADTSSASLRIFSKNIEAASGASEATTLKQEQLRLKVSETRSEITELNKRINENGDSSNKLRTRVSELSLKLKEYNLALKSSSDSFDELGIKTKNTEGKTKDFYTLLLEVADKFEAMPDGTKKTALALDLFGRSGASMIKVLNQGSDGIQELGDEAEKMGLVLSEGNVASFAEYIRATKQMTAINDSLRIQVGLLTAPVLGDFYTALNDVAMATIGVDGPLRTATAGVLAFGGPVLGAISGTAEFAANLIAALPAIKAFRLAVITPMVMPAIAVGAAIAALALVIAKTKETIAVVEQAGKAVDETKKSGIETDQAMKKMFNEGKINAKQLQGYIKNTNSVANQTKTNLYTGFFGPLNRAFDDLFARITGTKEKFKGSGFGEAAKRTSSTGWAKGGYTGRGGENEVAGIVHRGEYVLPKSQVDQSTGLPKSTVVGGNKQSITIQNLNLTTGSAVRAFFDMNDRDAQNAAMRLSPSRGQ